MENPCHTKAAYDAPLYQPRWNIGWLAEFGPLLRVWGTATMETAINKHGGYFGPDAASD